MEYKFDHLNDAQYLEAFNVMEQEHPFTHSPRNFFEEAFFYDEVYKEARLKIMQEADMKRWERLVELGVVRLTNDLEEVYDWEEVDSQL